MRKVFCIGLSAVLLLSCNRLSSSYDTPVVLGVGTLQVDTKAPSSENLLTSVFSVGDQMSVFLEPSSHYGMSARIFQATEVTSTPSTVFWGYPETVFFPSSGTVDIYAFSPSSVVGGAIRSTSVGFTVQSDQSSRAAYLASDLMYGSATGIASTSGRVPVAMTHALSRLTIRLSAGGLTSAEQSALLASLAGSTITLSGDILTNIEGFNLGNPSAAYTLGNTNGSPITFAAGVNPSFYNSAGDTEYSVILPPQTLSASTTLSISPAGGSTISGRFLSSLVLERGKEAVVTFSVVNRTLTLACIELVAWPSSPTGTGSVTF